MSRPARSWRVLRAVGGVWADLVVGDDWTVAAVVVLALLATWGLVDAGVPAWWLLPLAVIGATAASVRRAVARERPTAPVDRPGG